MINKISYDSFEDAENLKNAGFTEIQVKTEIARTKKRYDDINNLISNDLATKNDIVLLQRDLKELELRLIIKLSTILGSILAIGLTILGFMIHK